MLYQCRTAKSTATKNDHEAEDEFDVHDSSFNEQFGWNARDHLRFRRNSHIFFLLWYRGAQCRGKNQPHCPLLALPFHHECEDQEECPKNLQTHPNKRESHHTRGGMSSLLNRSEEHTSELQSPCNLVCRLLLEKKKK